MKGRVAGWRSQRVFLLFWFGITLRLFFLLGACSEKTTRKPLRETRPTQQTTSNPGIILTTQNRQQVVIDNGIVSVKFSRPEGYILGMSYKGIDNILEDDNEEQDRGYLDVVWNTPGKSSNFQRIFGTNFTVIAADDNTVELSFSRTWTPSMNGSSVPMNIDIRYILRSGDSGFYAYAIFDRPEGWPAVEIDQIRIVFKLKSKFNYMAMSDERQRTMPTRRDRETGQVLAYPEAVLLTRPANPEFRGEVDDKYQYSCENRDNTVHGWVSVDSNAPVGFWVITPSNEFRNAGPIKQDLTSHVGPITLAMFVSTHYAGKEVTLSFQEGEAYKKVFGPVFAYVNSASREDGTLSLWSDAAQQQAKEERSWPYEFPKSVDFIPPSQRGIVLGRLLVKDSYFRGGRLLYADNAYVGLALPGEAGSWQIESKGYQFWTQADTKGFFLINNIVPGDYNLYAWVPGFIGDYRYNVTITIPMGGGVITLDSLVFVPPRSGPTMWEIGFPDRTAAEFNIPDPYPTLMNKLYNERHSDKFRQYGLWERYTDLYPNDDLVYTVGVSKYNKDWFFAHVSRNAGNKTYQPTTWQIIFEHPNEVVRGNYTLQVALACTNDADLQIRLNDPEANPPDFATGKIGGDSAIARHGVHGLHRLFSISVGSDRILKGRNTIYLKQARSRNPFQGVMYDYIRLERPQLTVM
ncbi:uncharacterized protein LOC114176676 [Vigna unguiculata]|uniref:uncharacterized protein LOC114176676 n=1 Tax=Vigna unguiculata TaxID=3917 RepID=UPI001015DC2E|nr:uncharacterized protein LOC114176676 [Vigna unguiculata]